MSSPLRKLIEEPERSPRLRPRVGSYESRRHETGCDSGCEPEHHPAKVSKLRERGGLGLPVQAEISDSPVNESPP